MTEKKNNIEKEKTGYPHLDKPWMKYYNKNLTLLEQPKKTIYQNVRDNVQPYLDKTAITYNGEEINYDDFLRNIERFAMVLTAIDISTGKRVLYLMANIPETAYTLYGTNFIGAVSDYADPRPDSIDLKTSAKKILEICKKDKIDCICALDQCYLAMVKPIEDELKDIGINQVMIISPSDSMTKKGSLNYIDEYVRFNGLRATIAKLKKMKVIQEKLDDAIKTSHLKIIHYSDMINNVNSIHISPVAYSPNALTAITHSSGTSGTFPKSIPLTNEGIISYGFQLMRSNTKTHYNDSTLQILPFFSAYGLGIANFGHSMAYNMIQVPEFNPSNLGKMIKKYKPNAIMGTPNWYLSLPTDKALRHEDLSFIQTIGYGGDTMNPEDEKAVNHFLIEHNSGDIITKGHGMSEISGGASYAIDEYNDLGGMGIPMIDTIYAVVDPETKELLKFDDDQEYLQGELIVSSPAIVNSELDGNKVVEHISIDGIDFIYTGDIGKMDRNGHLFFLERKDRAFTRYDGFKVKPYQIENLIKNLNGIKDCIITPFFDESKSGNLIQANIILEQDFKLDEDVVKKIIDDAFTKNLGASTRQIPSKFVFRNQYPLTMNGKVAYKALSNIDDSLVFNVEFDETSISFDNLKITRNKNQKILKR